MIIPFSEWKPDSPDLGHDDSFIKNVMPVAEGYRSFPSLVNYSGALANRCQGAMMAKSAAGVIYNFAGDAHDLYSLSGTSWNVVSKSAGAYGTNTDDQWRFIPWGNKVIATNYADPVQVATLGGNFADLANAPKARHIGIVRDFIVVADTQDADGPVPYRVRWSGINNETQWTPNPQTMSDFQDLVGEGGANMAIVGGNIGYIFQERSIQRMTFVGSPLVFRFDVVEKELGAFASGSVVTKGTRMFFLSYDGFYMKDGDAPAVPISEGKVSKWFFNDLDQNYLTRITSVVDPINAVVMWAYPGAGNNGGSPNKIIMFHWPSGKWTHAEVNTEVLIRTASSGSTLEQLDALYPSIDTMPVSIDSRLFTGGLINLSAFTLSHILANFTGSNISATLETTETQLMPGRRAIIDSVRPLIQDGYAQAAVGTKSVQGDPVTWSPLSPQDSDGKCPVRVEGRYHRFRLQVDGPFSHAMGVEVEARPGGRR